MSGLVKLKNGLITFALLTGMDGALSPDIQTVS